MVENENLTPEQEKQINEAYDKMLNTANVYKETGEQSQEMYDNLKKELLEAANEKAEALSKGLKGESEHAATDKKNVMTEEEVEKVFDKLDEIQKSDPVLSSIANMPSNVGGVESAPNVRNYDDKDMTQHEVKVTVDAESGENKEAENTVEPMDIDLNDYLNMESNDTDKIEFKP